MCDRGKLGSAHGIFSNVLTKCEWVLVCSFKSEGRHVVNTLFSIALSFIF